MKPTCIYHGTCADGWTAAWIVANAFAAANMRADHGSDKPADAVSLHAGVYGHEPPWDLIDGKRVVIVDFSYPRAVMEQIIERAEFVIWLDHHQTAIDDAGDLIDKHPRKLVGKLDINRCGAWLAWEWFFPDEPVATLVKLVDDRDRWVFADPRTKPFNASLFSRHYTFEEWDKLARGIDQAVAEGEVILRDHMKKVAEIVDACTIMEEIGGHVVPSVNASHISASDACQLLLDRYPDAPFAVSWFMRGDRRVLYSLRSRKGSDVNVGEIAKQHGGGGHKHAAGFAV